MKKAFTIFVGFVHDFAAGIWLASVLAVWWIDRQVTQGLRPALQGLMEQFFYIGLVCTALVFLAGMGRTFTYAYIGSVYGEESEAQRRKLLMVKHVLLLSAFGLGTWWQYSIVFG